MHYCLEWIILQFKKSLPYSTMSVVEVGADQVGGGVEVPHVLR